MFYFSQTGDDLNNGKQKLDNIVKTIENNLVQLSECKEKLKSKDAKVDDCLAKADSTKETLNIDEYFGPVQPLYKQLFNAFAEENAIVDTTYNLNEALQKGVIDLDVFIKVRLLEFSVFKDKTNLSPFSMCGNCHVGSLCCELWLKYVVRRLACLPNQSD